MPMYTLPRKIGLNDHFCWGPVVRIISVEELDIDIVEALHNYEGSQVWFHPYVNQRDMGIHCRTIEEAMVFAMSRRKHTSHEMVRAACKLLDFTPSTH